jgi:sulfate permease, SulP family
MMTSPPISILFAKLFSDPDQLRKFMGYLQLSHIPAEKFIFYQGDPSDGIYLVLSGQLSPVRQLPGGQTQRLRTVEVGEIVGEGEVYYDVPRTVSLQATQPSYLYHLSNRAWETMEQESPALATEFHQYLMGLLAVRFKLDQALKQF